MENHPLETPPSAHGHSASESLGAASRSAGRLQPNISPYAPSNARTRLVRPSGDRRRTPSTTHDPLETTGAVQRGRPVVEAHSGLHSMEQSMREMMQLLRNDVNANVKAVKQQLSKQTDHFPRM